MSDTTPSSDASSVARTGNAAGVGVEEAPVATVPLDERHDTESFKCSKSARVERFFVTEWPVYKRANYCKVFVLQDTNDANKILGYYTLSAATMEKAHYTNGDEKRAPLGINPPMVRIGFMGKCDGAPKGLGKLLIADAANRISRITDIGFCGIVLEPEGGLGTKLATFYESLKFKRCRVANSMYALLKDLV